MWTLILCFIAGIIVGYILGFYSFLEVFLGTLIDWIIENLFRMRGR
jgi:hypothetical protein